MHYVEKSLWFLAGAGIGAGATFLFGTREGRRVQRQVRRWAEDCGERLTASGQEVLEKGKELCEHGREFVNETQKMVGRGWRELRKAS